MFEPGDYCETKIRDGYDRVRAVVCVECEIGRTDRRLSQNRHYVVCYGKRRIVKSESELTRMWEPQR